MIHVAAFYRFSRIHDPARLRPPLEALCRAESVRGSVLLAREGVNGTIAGPRQGVDQVLEHLRGLPGCDGMQARESRVEEMPFRRMKVRLKREIVTLGRPEVDPLAATGHYVEPADWNALITAPDVAVIDTRNAYEVEVGSFAGAIDPGTESFGAFPDWWRANRGQFEGKRIAMFCTGGIRCEKATSFLIGEGVEGVHHLRGGILNYLQEVPTDQSLWRGECYVFDGRVSLGHGLAPGSHVACHACGRPVSPEAQTHADFEPGVQCPACKAEFGAADRARFRERQRQIELARERAHRPSGVT